LQRKRKSDYLPCSAASLKKQKLDMPSSSKVAPYLEYYELSTQGVDDSLEEKSNDNSVVLDKKAFQNHLQKNGYKYQNSNAKHGECSTDLEKSLKLFTDLDVLDEDNKFICKRCTERNKSKCMHVCNIFNFVMLNFKSSIKFYLN